MRFASTLAAIALLAPAAGAAEYSVPQLRLPLMASAPVIDGVIHDDEWQSADRMERFGRPEPLTAQSASFWVGSDGKELFLAVRSETPPGGKLLANVEPGKGDEDANAFADDSIELYICPRPDAPVAERTTYLAILNSRGAILDQTTGAQNSPAWRGHWRIKNTVTADHWDCEIAIPWTDFGLNGPLDGQTTAIRLARNWRQSADLVQTEWSPLGGGYTTVSTMPHVRWDHAAPVVQVLHLQDAPNSPANIRLRLFNPGPQVLPLQVHVEMSPRESQPTRTSQLVSLKPGQTQELSVPGAALGAEPIYTRILVTSPDGAATYYSRDFSWQVSRPNRVWDVLQTAAVTRTKFAYFPTASAMHVAVNLATLPNRAEVKAVQLEVRKQGENTPLARVTMPPLHDAATELPRWELPVLSEGNYELVARFEGTTLDPEVLPFERKHFPWEGNHLGLSDTVLPPFTPLTLQGSQVETILRRHTMNGVGLWDQVVADGQPLLQSPMRLEARVGGKTFTAAGKLAWSSQNLTHAVGTAQWSAGPMRGSTQSSWDYDGCMRTVFNLPVLPKNLESLALVIPFDGTKAPLMDECADGLRFNYAGQIPPGQGRVWDSTKGQRTAILGNYLPYIWVGGPERGISVFGENDKGWVIDDKSVCQEIVRRPDGNVELRLNLIQRAPDSTAGRKIEIGFLATPIKPMPADWRLWTVGSRGSVRVPGQYHMAFLGACLYYGGVTASDDLYPRDEDFRIWDQLVATRQTGKIDRDFTKQWVAGYKVADTPAGQRQREGYRVHVEAGLYNMAAKPQGVLPYTNPRGMRLDTPPVRTYLDEWTRDAFPPRDAVYGASLSYGVDPVPSFRDFSAYYWQKMLTSFADGIYWDNGFLADAFDPITTEAYVRPDGKTQPAMGLWNMRETVERGAALAQELGKTNRNMVHMTGTPLAPILAFTPSQLSWEFSLGDIDFQDRFKRDTIQTESIGRQFGTTPFVLTLINGPDPEKVKWAARTAAGVMLTHELKPIPAVNPVPDFWKQYDNLVSFGYGSPAVQVWDYWQPDYPVQLSGETSSLLLSKPGELLLVVCDWAEGGELKAKLDLKALKLAGALAATDAETGAALPASASGELSFSLKKHDFRVIRIQAAKTP